MAKRKPTQYVYAFGNQTDGGAELRNTLGGKGANLAEMARIGLPVPPGFTLVTDVCNYYYDNDRQYPPSLEGDVAKAMRAIENQLDKRFGDPVNPLLLSVRSGARESMPGMMDTILNLGLNDETVEGLAEATANPRFAYDCYRRFIHMYADVVMGVNDENADPFEHVLEAKKRAEGVELDSDLSAEGLAAVIDEFKSIVRNHTGEDFPQDVGAQLWGAIGAVFGSWLNDRAVLYRQRYGIPRSWGTAVNVQAMVFGNLGETSGTGVAFTRDPATGEKVLYGEYLVNAQGEDVVAGVRTPNPIAQMVDDLPKSHAELEKVRTKLERHFRDMQDFEFTVENGKLFMLQTRNGKRTGLAAVRIAVEMNRERLIDRKTALMKIPAESIDSLLVPVFDHKAVAGATPIATGLPAGPGAASGEIAFTSDRAEELTRKGKSVVLCRTETSPDDLKGMLNSAGILTSRGGVSSHAALVARQLGKVCVCGAASVVINYDDGTLNAGDAVLKEGDWISIDGSTGEIFAGPIETTASEVQRVLRGRLKPEKSYHYQLYATVMSWSDALRRVKIRTNADTPSMAKQAIEYGAESIGLCRTEHMFFEETRIDHMREMILAPDETARRAALKKLLPYQRRDFKGLFQAMGGKPVTIRLLDPPLHEFLPHDDGVSAALAEKLGVPVADVLERTESLAEVNPMLGCRGCRLGIMYPEITEMQARAIFEAAIAASSGKNAVVVLPEIMVPLVGFVAELEDQVAIVRRVADEVMSKKGVTIEYQVGTMIEVPRAAITADEIAEVAEFFSFGTNDLTQMTLGLSRDDMGSFYDQYVAKEIYGANPFASIDESGVGRLVSHAARLGRSTRQGIKLGICGEHGGDPSSIRFCQETDLDYVSCSPPRVPVARLAAAQAAISLG